MIRADRFLNVPMALLPRETERIMRAIERRDETQAMIVEFASPPDRLYDLQSGVAIVRIGGILIHEEDFFSYWFGESGYGGIRAAFDQALADPEAKAIVLHVNSPGGEVAGCFDLAEHIYAARGTKPVVAILDESAYSAAYALACAADLITVPRTGGTGSIGVVTMHVDITKALDEFGIKVTTIQFGARKTDSYPTTPLSSDAQKRFQADIDAIGEMFVDLVARCRDIPAAAVRKMEAGTFLGEAGVEQKLADAVLSPSEAFAALLADIG